MGFQFILILGLLGMYFDAAVLFVTKPSLLFMLVVTLSYVQFLLTGVKVGSGLKMLDFLKIRRVKTDPINLLKVLGVYLKYIIKNLTQHLVLHELE